MAKRFKKGDRVAHQNSRQSFGTGRVLRVIPGGGVLVRWHTHRVKRLTDRLSTKESHVARSSLKRVRMG
jgi:hypothetical protein